MQPETMRLNRRVAVVTGGPECSAAGSQKPSAGAGARAVIVGRNPEKGGAVVTGITDLSGVTRFVSCDATGRAQLRALVSDVVAAKAASTFS